MGDVIDGLKNHSIREAKDAVLSRIVEEAQGEGTPLSELERKIKDVIRIRHGTTRASNPFPMPAE